MNHPGETELDPRDWWSTADVAAWCDVTQGTIRAYVVRGQMPAPVRIGRAMVWPAEQIRRWRPKVSPEGQGGSPVIPHRWNGTYWFCLVCGEVWQDPCGCPCHE